MEVSRETNLVHLGGMGRVRLATRICVAICIASAVLLVVESREPSIDVAPFLATHVAALAIGVGLKMRSLRSVLFVSGGWALAPVLGDARPMRAIVDVYESGDDVVVVDRDGRVILLGVDRLGARDPARARQALVETLKQLEQASA